MTDDPSFAVVLLGYRRSLVDRLFSQVVAAQASDSVDERVAAVEALRQIVFPKAIRGYDRFAVDRAVYAALKDLTGTDLS